MKINYIKGDATNPINVDNIIIIPHIVNNLGGWGRGFVLAISKKWKEPEISYRKMSLNERKLNEVQFIKVEDNIIISNMVAQEGIGCDINGKPPIRYEALKICLTKVNEKALELNATLHMPRIGCGLAGGTWDVVEKIIQETITVDVYVYDLK